MKALTICQPYAGAILDGRKRVENRTWETPYRGELIIHAGKSKQWLETWDETYEGPFPDPMPFGAVVGIAELVACYRLYKIRAEQRALPEKHAWVLAHQHTEGPFCWVLGNVRKLETPIPWSGKQGLWNGAEIVESDAWKNNKLIPVEPR